MLKKQVLIERTEPAGQYKPRLFKVQIEENGELVITTYYLGSRGARFFGGTATITLEELKEIVVAVEKVRPEVQQFE